MAIAIASSSTEFEFLVGRWRLELPAGIARVADEESEREALEAAVRAHKQAPSVRWKFFLCQPRYFQGR
jgi:hypothetical protein